MIRRARLPIVLAVVAAVAFVSIGRAPHLSGAPNASTRASGEQHPGRVRAALGHQELGVFDVRGERFTEAALADYGIANRTDEIAPSPRRGTAPTRASHARSMIAVRARGSRAPPAAAPS